jgi:peptidyl-dipeptidase Dcp
LLTADSSGASSLLAPWTGPRGGAPAFDQAKVEDFQAALLAAIDQNRAEIAAIAANPEAPTFANTIAALEDSGRALSRVSAVYGVFTSTMNDAAMQTVEQEMAPVLAAFFDEVIQNGALFARIKAVHESADSQGLGVEEQRLAWRTHRRFTRHGAELSANEKGRMGEINQRLASLSTTFSQNQLADEEGDFLTLETEGDLAGLPPSLVAAAQASAKTKGLEGAWVITNTRSSMEPFLTYSSRRAEKAKLLGYPSFAHWITGDQMAATPDAAMDLLLEVWAPAKARAASEIADMQALAQAENPGVKIEAWDGRYYAEKVRKARYDLDEDELKPYLRWKSCARRCSGRPASSSVSPSTP